MATTETTLASDGQNRSTTPLAFDSTLSPFATIQLISGCKHILHHPKAGINPIVDAAGALFTVMGKLKRTSAHPSLADLRLELTSELKQFELLAHSHRYPTETILLSRYALSATLDDIALSAPWGNGQWHPYMLSKDLTYHDQFLKILEKIIKSPHLNMDLIELLYFCFSLGFKGGSNGFEMTKKQLEHITDLLYKQIRVHRGSILKTLSPFPLQPMPIKPRATPLLNWLLPIGAVTFAAAFLSMHLLVNQSAKRTLNEITTVGNLIEHENRA